MCCSLQDCGEDDKEKHLSAWDRFVRFFRVTSSEGLLGQGLAKQVGNVTECALLGFVEELGKDCTSWESTVMIKPQVCNL